MTASRWCSVLLFCIALSTLAGAGENAARPPNFVFILADDLGWADLGCYGNRFNETPNIDKLAAQGLRFTHFRAAAAVCSPTRASILTGQYPARIGMTAHIPGHWRPFEKLVEPPCALGLPPDLTSLPKALRSAGYATAHFGKWHLGGKSSSPKEQGFDEVFEFIGHAVPSRRLEPPAETPRRAAEYLTERGIRFIESSKDKPFFLYLCHSAVHIPIETTPELLKKYQAKPKIEGYSCHPAYAGLLEEMDQGVGRIVEALERLGLAENTLLVFVSDNGGLEREMGGWPGTLNRPLRDEKGTLYEGGLRVPCIARWPGTIKAGSESGAAAVSVDFFPTLLEMARPAGRDAGPTMLPKDQPVDGLSLVPLFKDPAAELKREALYWHYPHYHHSRPSGAILAGGWKAIEFFDTGELELYNLKDDLSEARNLAAQMPEKARELRTMLKSWRLSVNAQMPQQNPAHNPQRANEWWSRAKIAPTEAPGTYKPAP